MLIYKKNNSTVGNEKVPLSFSIEITVIGCYQFNGFVIKVSAFDVW